MIDDATLTKWEQEAPGLFTQTQGRVRELIVEIRRLREELELKGRQQVEAFRERAVELVVERAKHYARKHRVHLRDDEESWWRARKIEVESIIVAIRALSP